MKPIERLSWFLKEHKIKLTAAEKRSGLGLGYLSKQIRNQASIGADILEKICNAFPELNAAWLLTGKGHFLNTGGTKGDAAQPEADDKLALIEKLNVNYSEKYALCRLLVQKLLLQVTLLEKELHVLRTGTGKNI